MKNSNNNRYIVGLGELLWDCFPTYRRIGGAPANFAYHAAQFGHDALVVSAIGDDEDGRGLVKTLDDHHLPHHLEVVPLPTGTVLIDDSKNNDPKYNINTDVAWSAIPFNKELEEIARNSRVVCYGTLAQYGSVSRDTICRFLNCVPDDCYKIYDINLRDNLGFPLYDLETIQSSILRCNIFKVNIDELDYLVKALPLDVAASDDVVIRSRCLMSRYPNIQYLIVTMGADGSWIFDPVESSHQDTPKVKLVDTVGAGDSFTGAFIGSLLNGKTMQEAHKIAVDTSAYVCTQPEGMPKMLSLCDEIGC